MPVTTFSAAYHITPVVIKTFLDHGRRKANRIKDGEPEDSENARDADIFFDEGFNIVKRFVRMGTENTVESLQGFTNTHVPAPYWAAVSPVVIPFSSANRAADALKDWFSPEELRLIVGGERWWQVRGLDGIDAEWITEKEFLSDKVPDEFNGRKLSSTEEDIVRMEELESVMFYIHGGGYFWGSINTHRYQLIRMARKCKGRVFAPNYRKAPQYPWPCPLQDVLAAYFYLIDPPPSALHKPVSPSKIVIAGDSAGGGLSLALLTILRDLGLPLPAGGVLISPWVDLTHSFPSVMTNTESDIVPPHGFLAKPSALWPVDPLPPPGGRVARAESGAPPEPGNADTLIPDKNRVREEEEEQRDPNTKPQTQEDMFRSAHRDHGVNMPASDQTKTVGSVDSSEWEPKPPKVLMKDPHAIPLELRSQIQMYATTQQLSHPLVSPILQGSLGSLPPLYIIAGDGEMLRDEIIYMAHKAAHPSEYPTRTAVLKRAHRQADNAKQYTEPTRVHLQVFDDMCHVLTVFTFTKSAKYAYRSIAQFVKHVTKHDEEHLKRNPFPELHRPVEEALPSSPSSSQESDIDAFRTNVDIAVEEVKEKNVDTLPHASISAPPDKDISGVLMIRERVNIDGISRSMEDAAEIPALNIKPGQIGLIKEEPCLRWYEGQQIWDERYHKQAVSALKRRRRLSRQYEQLLRHAKESGLVLLRDSSPSLENALKMRPSNQSIRTIAAQIQEERRWGPLDLEDEKPPPSAIVGRRDTLDSLALLKKHVFYTAPRTHLTVPKFTTADVLRAAFNPDDNPVRPPQQPEEQTSTHFMPMHGVRIWNGIVTYFMKKSSKKMMSTITPGKP